ncbi:hypothetical protein E2C01_034032 [Portunus trituberculatus]|uniref:Uncharacterized protein n=1 Tax=Portunus trituberculatus TaxID=210409 RepID=A0A5B7F5V1_PORTR|nr:hypothetical protein [Portunus trituberculatus]
MQCQASRRQSLALRLADVRGIARLRTTRLEQLGWLGCLCESQLQLPQVKCDGQILALRSPRAPGSEKPCAKHTLARLCTGHMCKLAS